MEIAVKEIGTQFLIFIFCGRGEAKVMARARPGHGRGIKFATFLIDYRSKPIILECILERLVQLSIFWR